MDTDIATLANLGESIESFATLVDTYGAWVIFISVFLTGETAILISFMLTEQGALNFSTVFILATLATLCADVFWFTVGRYFPPHWLPQSIREKMLGPTNRFIGDLLGTHVFVPILLFKFFIGMRIATIVYFARQPLSFITFLVYNTVSITIYLSTLGLLGTFFGLAISEFVPAYQTTITILSGLLIIFIISRLVRYSINQKIGAKK